MPTSLTTRPAVTSVDLEAALTRLDVVLGQLAAPPADRDAVLWAAHELTACARLLISTRHEGPGAADDLGAAMDYARSAMACLTVARRQEQA